MTVLVSRRAADDRRRQAGPRRGLRLDRRHLGVARRLLRRRRHPRRSCCSRAARSPRRSSCSRSPTARWCSSLDTDFDGCMAIVQQLAAEERRLPGQLDELAAARGPEDGRRSRSCSSSTGRCPTWVIIPGGNLGNVSALGAGFDMMETLGLITQAAAHRRRAGGARQPALPRVSARLGISTPVPAQPTLASAIQIGNPVSVKKAIRTLQKLRRRRRAGERSRARRRGGARRSHRHVQLPAHRRRAGGARSSCARAARSIRKRARGRDLDGQRPEVHRLQDPLPRARSSTASRRRTPTTRSSCRTTTTRFAAPSTASVAA